MNNNWVPKKNIIIAVTALLGLSLILYLGSIFMVVKKQKEIKNLLHNTESEISKNERRWMLKSILATHETEIKTLRNFFIKKGDEIGFIEQIEELGRVSGVVFEIRSIDVKAKSDSSIKEDVIVKMNIEGDWESTIKFMDRLEKMPFGVLVESLDLKSNMVGQWIGSISMVVFREK